MTIYKMTFENYQGETFFELYHNKVNAQARFYELKEENKNQSEFHCYSYDSYEELYFFDPNYNEYGTAITLEECSLDNLFYD